MLRIGMNFVIALSIVCVWQNCPLMSCCLELIDGGNDLVKVLNLHLDQNQAASFWKLLGCGRAEVKLMGCRAEKHRHSFAAPPCQHLSTSGGTCSHLEISALNISIV